MNINFMMIIAAYAILMLHHLRQAAGEESKEQEDGNLDRSYDFYFVETKYDRSIFSVKQMCAIESAAKHNPTARVRVLTLNTQLSRNPNFLLDKYANIEIFHFEPEQTLADNAAMLAFWKKGDMMKSKHALAHMSDFLRYFHFTLLIF